MPKKGEKGNSPTVGLAPEEEQAPEMQVTLPAVFWFWAGGPSREAMGHRLATP